MPLVTSLNFLVLIPLKWFLHLFGITALVVLVLLPLLLACFPETPKGAVLILAYTASITMQISGSEWLPSRKGLLVSLFFVSMTGSSVILLISYRPLPVWNQLSVYITLALWSLILYIADGIFQLKAIKDLRRHIAEIHAENT